MNVVTWVGLAIAATQAFIALSLFLLTRKIHLREVRHQSQLKEREDAFRGREERLARDIHSNEIKLQRLLKLQEWGNECIDVLAETDHFFKFDAQEVGSDNEAKRRNNLLRRLSSLIDRGRIFFKNEIEPADALEVYKQPAYRGLRPRILDPMVAAYCALNVLGKQNPRPDNKTNDRLIEWRKYYVSLLQYEVGKQWTEIPGFSELLGGGQGDSINEHSNAPRIYNNAMDR